MLKDTLRSVLELVELQALAGRSGGNTELQGWLKMPTLRMPTSSDPREVEELLFVRYRLSDATSDNTLFGLVMVGLREYLKACAHSGRRSARALGLLRGVIVVLVLIATRDAASPSDPYSRFEDPVAQGDVYEEPLALLSLFEHGGGEERAGLLRDICELLQQHRMMYGPLTAPAKALEAVLRTIQRRWMGVQ